MRNCPFFWFLLKVKFVMVRSPICGAPSLSARLSNTSSCIFLRSSKQPRAAAATVPAAAHYQFPIQIAHINVSSISHFCRGFAKYISRQFLTIFPPVDLRKVVRIHARARAHTHTHTHTHISTTHRLATNVSLFGSARKTTASRL